MKDDKYFWDFNQKPGKKINSNYVKNFDGTPLVTIITSYHNSKKYMWQTINCVFNQTFPFWEWVIADDKSTNDEDIEYLKTIQKMDSRIKVVYKKENGGLAKGRDFAIKYATTDLILPLDDDDLIEPTFIETLYFGLLQNKYAAWAFCDSVGFGKYFYLSDKKFDSDEIKKENYITATALIKKEKILEMGGYSQAKRYVNEDYHLWLRMLANGNYPVQLTYYGFWYRRRENSLLTHVNDDQNKENELRLRDLKIEADKIKESIKSKYYPSENNIQKLEFVNLETGLENLRWNDNNNILYIIPNTGLSRHTYKEIKNKSNSSNIYIITLDITNESQYVLRQKYEQFATVYNLTTLLDRQFYLAFINYLIATRNITEIYYTNTLKDSDKIKKFLSDKEINEICYRENDYLYKLKICWYVISHTLPARAIRRLWRVVKTKKG